MSIRDERANAYWPLWLRHQHEPKTMLPLYLDALEAIDAEHPAPTVIVEVDAELTEERAAELREQVATALKPAAAKAAPAEVPAKTTPPRRATTRKRTT